MKTKTDQLHFLKKGEQPRRHATGVSLHCHSLHSKEMLDFVPYYAERIPVLRRFWHREMRKRKIMYGRVPDFTLGYWEPPLTGVEVFKSEIESLKSLGLSGMVSITDHDSISANLELNASSIDIPISMEWTVPFEEAFFHVGVHNLPAENAEDITAQLLAYSNQRSDTDRDRLTQLFAMLNQIPEVLVVLNHPIWDIEMIGQVKHERLLKLFLERHKSSIHAVEVNGFRSWGENRRVIDLGADLELPVISGGDRHCCQSNTMINLTNASTFSEFVSEVRVDKKSSVAITPEYHVPLPSRQLASMAQILSDYKHFPEGRRVWSDRIMLDSHDGTGLRSLTDQWDGKRPLWSFLAIGSLKILSHPAMRPFLALTVGDADIGVEPNGQVTPKTIQHPISSEQLKPKTV